MTIPILTACAGAPWEAIFVSAAGGGTGVEVVRRCVDTADLVATASLRAARVAFVDARLPGVDRGVVHALQTLGVAIVGVAPDEVAEARLRLMGVGVVVGSSAEPTAMLEAMGEVMSPRRADESPSPAQFGAGDGEVIAVWGPTGAPGRSTVAMSVADECAAVGVPTMLVDADVYGGSIAQMLGILDEAPGLLAAARLANEGRLDADSLAACARRLPSGLLVLTGITRPQRWTELRPESFLSVLEACRHLVEVVVVDCSFCIEQDEELVFDTMAPRRNGVSVSTLSSADQVLLVAAGDPLGLQRAIRAGISLTEDLAQPRPHVVVTRVRKGPVPGRSPQDHVTQMLSRHLGITPIAMIPSDRSACDRALAQGRTLREVAPGSAARIAMRDLARVLAPASEVGWLRRRRQPRVASPA